MSREHNLISVHMSGFHEEEVDLTKYETSFRRWLVSEIELGHMTVHQAREKFKLPHRFDMLFKQWQLKYSSTIHLSLRAMTPEELADFNKLQERIKELEQQLEAAQIKNVLTESMIDIAEKQMKLEIRKKFGPKQ